MKNAETWTGGSREGFPESVWSSILASPDSPLRRERINTLLSQYWRPVYRYFRTSGAATIEDAKDLTQDFFEYLLEGDIVASYRTDQGRFRQFIKGVLRNFLSMDRRERRSLKRGGNRAIHSLDVDSLETEAVLADARGLTPEQLFDRQWADELLQQGLDALRSAIDAETYRAYEAYELHPSRPDAPTYADIARELGMSVRDVENRLRAARARLRELLRERVAGYVTSEAELFQELQDLFRE